MLAGNAQTSPPNTITTKPSSKPNRHAPKQTQEKEARYAALQQAFSALQKEYRTKHAFANELIKNQAAGYEAKLEKLEAELLSTRQSLAENHTLSTQKTVLSDKLCVIEAAHETLKESYCAVVEKSQALVSELNEMREMLERVEEANQTLNAKVNSERLDHEKILLLKQKLDQELLQRDDELAAIRIKFDELVVEGAMKSDLLLEKGVALKDIEANLNQKSAYAVILSNSLNEQQKMLTLLQEQIETQSLDHQLLLQNEQQKVSRLQESLEGALYQYDVLKKIHAEQQATFDAANKALVVHELELGKAYAHNQEVELKLLKCNHSLQQATDFINQLKVENQAYKMQSRSMIELVAQKEGEIEKLGEFCKKLEEFVGEQMKGWFGGKKDVFKLFKWKWADDAEVTTCHTGYCDVQFGLLNRKHHCRRCGNIFCSKHVKGGYKLSLSGTSFNADGFESKLCLECIEELSMEQDSGSVIYHSTE